MDATADLFLRQLGEPALDEVDPRGALGSEVDVEAWPLGEPASDERGLVRAVVIHDDVHIEILRNTGLDGVQKPTELHRTMPTVHLSDHIAACRIQGSEERSRTVARVVMGPSFYLPRPHREKRLTPIQGLNLRLLVHTQHQGF